MYKKITILVTVITILFACGYFGYKRYIYYYPPNGTGAALSEINQAELDEGKAINKLIKSLPLQFDNFSIESYDYTRGKFRIVLNGKLNTTSEVFLTWLSLSEYKSIPVTMFEFSTSN